MELLKRAKRFLKGLKKNAGFTLPEVTAVVAITGTLAAIVVPVAVDQIEKGRNARAATDVDSIANAAGAFFRDTGEWPDRKGATADHYFVLRSGNTGATFDLFSTTPTTGNVEDPGAGTTNWDSFGVASGKADAFVNHLTLDQPGGSSSDGYRAADVNWSGPYMPQVFNDPWGRNYLVYARAFYTPNVANIAESSSGAGDGATGGDIYVWVISGGPNKILETNVTSPILNDAPQSETAVTTPADDVGKMMFKAREAIAGVSAGG